MDLLSKDLHFPYQEVAFGSSNGPVYMLGFMAQNLG